MAFASPQTPNRSYFHSLALGPAGVALLCPAVFEVERQVVGVRAASSQSAALPAEGPLTQVVADQGRDGRAHEQNTVARRFPIVAVA